MIAIRSLSDLDSADLVRVASGYSSTYKYVVAYTDTPEHTSFELQLTALAEPYVRQYCFDDKDIQECRRVLAQGYSFAAFDDALLVGLIIAEPQSWNQSMWIREFHVAETHRRRGIGRQLMFSVTERGRQEGFRILVCETQSTNIAAVAFYRGLGFLLEGIDISYYTNQDYPDGEIAVFMKKRLD